MKVFLILLFTLSINGLLFSQINKDSILLNERSIDRPITLHAGQLRISGGYGLHINSKQFNSEGDTELLKDKGFTNILHHIYVDVKYGITKNAGLSIIMAHKSQSERGRMEYILASPEPTLEITYLYEKVGFTDLFISGDLRLPIKTKKLDLVASVGVFFPTAKSEPDQPAIESASEGTSLRTIHYHFNNNWGDGTMVLNYTGILKYRTSKFAFQATSYYQEPVEEGESIHWYYESDNTYVISYKSQTYRFIQNRELGYSFLVEYQALPWLNLFSAYLGRTSNGGWSEMTGKKVKNEETSYSNIVPGFEILVTSKFWLKQQVILSLSGMNELAPFGVYTTLSYNFFPFN